jgi:hypothetical protein
MLLGILRCLDAHCDLFRGSKPACGWKRFFSIQFFINIRGQSSARACAATNDLAEWISLGFHSYLIGKSRN